MRLLVLVWLFFCCSPCHSAYLRDVNGSLTDDLPNASFVIPLEEAQGTVHITLHVGQPSQAQNVIVDTGSHLAAMTCTPNKRHHHQQQLGFPPLQPQRSTTLQITRCGDCTLNLRANDNCRETDSRHDTCPMGQRYTEGSSWTAYEVTDVISFSNTSFDQLIVLAFGCQTSVTGLFQHQYANGILGMERSTASMLSRLVAEKVLQRHAFSLCIPGTVDGGPDSSSRWGWMAWGGTLPQHHLEPMAFVPLQSTHGLYTIHVEQIWIGSHCVACSVTARNALQGGSKGGVVVDSGTTDTFLPHALRPAFYAAWLALTGWEYEATRTRPYTHAEFLKLPTIQLVLSHNVTWTVPPLHYMEFASPTQWGGSKELVNRIYLDERDGAVLGINAQRGYDILYDAQGGRLGIAKARCDNHF